MAEHVGDKSHDPTPHRRQQARRQGQAARSQDLASAVLLLGGLAAIWTLGRPLVAMMVKLTVRQLSGEPWLAADVSFAVRMWNQTLWGLAVVLLPILGVIAVAGIAANVLQVGLQFQPGRIAPDLARVNPLAGMTRIMSASNLTRLPVGIVKLLVVTGVAWYGLEARVDVILGCGRLPVGELAATAGGVLLGLTCEIACALLVLAGLDYALARWRHERDLRMTTQELREEMKNLQGSPQLAARRRGAPRDARTVAPLTALAAADVIVASGDRTAVALRYDPATMAAPQIVAKGTGAAAQRLRASAAEQRVPLVERDELAQSLYQLAAANRPISRDVYPAVAELLAQMPSVGQARGS